MEQLLRLLRMDQEKLKNHLSEELRKKEYKPINKKGYLYAKGNIPVMLVAHMDIVGSVPPKTVHYYEPTDVLYNPQFDTVLGGDDRCGVYAILKLTEKYRPFVLFTEDEEIGCIGARIAAKEITKPKVKYIIEIDRRGKDDCVFYDCGNDEFIDYVEEFGFKLNHGSCSDISILGSEWDIASVNLSSGYYHEHTPEEIIVFGELQNTIKRASKMLSKIDKAPYFDYQDQFKDYNGFYGFGYGYGYGYGSYLPGIFAGYKDDDNDEDYGDCKIYSLTNKKKKNNRDDGFSTGYPGRKDGDK